MFKVKTKVSYFNLFKENLQYFVYVMKDDNQMIFSYLNTYPLMKSYLVLKLCENLHCFFACVSLLQSYNAENISLQSTHFLLHKSVGSE